jgi:hypothetical protein
MTITPKAMEWRERIAEELPHQVVGVAPVRPKSSLDYAHLIIGGINVEIIYNQTIKLPATDDRPNELEWTEAGWVVVYDGEDCDTAKRTVYLHPQENWNDEFLLGEIIGAYWFVSE